VTTDGTPWDTRYEWRAIALLTLASGLLGLDRFVVNPLFPAMMRDLSLDYQDLGNMGAVLAARKLRPRGSESADRAAIPLGPHSHERHGCEQDAEQRGDVWAVLTQTIHYLRFEMRPGRDDGNNQQKPDPQCVERQ
jgi:hypothetical protein